MYIRDYQDIGALVGEIEEHIQAVMTRLSEADILTTRKVARDGIIEMAQAGLITVNNAGQHKTFLITQAGRDYIINNGGV